MDESRLLKAACILITALCVVLLFIIVVDKWDEIVHWYKEAQKEAELVRQQQEILRRLAGAGIR